ncbi:MAG: flavodoxin family protein [Spirochaetales bacterium]|nr:flavodoxin family protein [Spirochaetales bacterium]
MNITILDGSPSGSATKLPPLLGRLSAGIREKHSVNHFSLASMDLHFCTGCWSCWWKTPGLCAIKDDAEEIFRAVINSDLVIFVSPLKAGFTSSLLKKITDRLIVLLHPYIEIRNNECHHIKRYESYPDIGLIFEKSTDTDDEDLQIIRDIYERLALNFHSRLKYAMSIDDNTLEEILNETCSI